MYSFALISFKQQKTPIVLDSSEYPYSNYRVADNVHRQSMLEDDHKTDGFADEGWVEDNIYGVTNTQNVIGKILPTRPDVKHRSWLVR